MAACMFQIVLFSAAVSAHAELWMMGDHECDVFNKEAPHIVIIFHGYGAMAEDFHELASRFVELGYAAVVPRDNIGAFSIFDAAKWGPHVAATIRDGWALGRPIAIVGHSMGGAAAMSAARTTPGIAAYVAMHPAPAFSGDAFTQMQGPILFTTGTYDDGVFAGATSPSHAQESYSKAGLPKALLNIRGNGHDSVFTSVGLEWQAVSSWIGCFVRKESHSCKWLQAEMCNSENLEWCNKEFGQAMSMLLSKNGPGVMV